ncbi:MAG: hypothetical protein OSJ27_05580 [Candidatus Gastranaerophilales bacterium]|nr:hypothetical protein [Candidatus Gastranaerophilales bacterium]
MSLLTFKNSNIQNNMSHEAERPMESGRALGYKSGVQSPLSNPVKNTIKERNAQNKIQPKKLGNQSAPQNQIISGYFVQEKSYKEMVIARINNFLCGVLALLVMVCLVSYYFVINGEIQLNQIRKETLAINYDNEDMQHRLDILQSFSNVDRQVSRTKILQTAKQVIELSAANLPNVDLENKNVSPVPGWSMGY